MSEKLKKYNLRIDGRDFGIFIGELSEEQFEFWNNQNEYSLSDALTGSIDDEGIPEDARLPFHYSDLPGIENESGPVVEDSMIYVSDDDGVDIFSDQLAEIEHNNLNVEPVTIAQNIEPGFYVKVEIGNKGSLFTGEFTATAFDPKKLKIDYAEIEGMGLMTAIYYDGHQIEDTGAWDNYGKYLEVDLFEVLRPVNELLEKANDLYSSGKIREAIKFLEVSIAETEESASFTKSDFLKVKRQLAIYTMCSSDHKKADILLKNNLSDWKKLEGVYSKGYAITSGYYAANLVELGKYSAAIPYSQRYLASYNGAYHWHNLALALENCERYLDAESAYRRAIEASDEQDDFRMKIHSLYGLYHVRNIDRERRDSALEFLNEAIEIAREHKDAESLKMLLAELEIRKR